MARTVITPFRFPADIVADLDRLKEHLALPSRAAVAAMAIRKLAHAELPDARTPEKPRKKSLKKSG